MDPLVVAREKFESKIHCTPSDEIFADANGDVVDAVTPSLLIGARLCDRFEITKYIESGAFGRGWVAVDHGDGDRKVFLKTFRSQYDRPSECDPKAHEGMVRKEIEVLLQADAHRIPEHPSLVNGVRVYYGDVVVPKTKRKGAMFFLVSKDLCEGGELYNYLVFGAGIKKLDEPIARYFFKQIAEGVAHMHHNGMFHRDLKLENIVLDAHYNAKIMDFGHAKHASECETTVDSAGETVFATKTFVGTSSYQPPELKEGNMFYNPAAFDVWSLGVILFFITGIEGLAARGNDFTFMTKVRRGDEARYKLLDQKRSDKVVPDNARFWEFFGSALKFSPELKHLLNGLFDSNPKRRMKIDDVLAHPWLKGPMPSRDQVVAALSGRSTGLAERDFIFSLADKAKDQDTALKALESIVKTLAPYVKTGHKIGVCKPPKFAIAVNKECKVRIMWLTGGLDEWLEFRGIVCKELGIEE